ncbi:hypothetical protein PUN28_013379 [Cardiocondyla obscurior]|uniref:Uncharacterized protein n=1 Tax=Cardiocondyla obscurior TaxID=286306 RepID=A0AAW2FBH1_9HYME
MFYKDCNRLKFNLNIFKQKRMSICDENNRCRRGSRSIVLLELGLKILDRSKGNEREMPVLSREERICYATVGFIPQEGRRQNRDAELFCRNLKRKKKKF